MSIVSRISTRAYRFAVLIAVSTYILAFGCVFIAYGGQSQDLTQGALLPLPDLPALDQAKVELGRQLFNDKILSSKGMLACTSCHDLASSGTVPLKRTVGYDGRMHRFNAPTIFNVANNYRLGWRGDFTSLEQQNEAVLLDRNLMSTDWATLLSKLRGSLNYEPLFLRAYGHRPDRESVLDALATFQRSLLTPSPFDRYLRGDASAISDEAKTGYALFDEYGCTSCHQGSNVGGNMFQKFGIFADPQPLGAPVSDGDLGRWTITGADRDIGVFRVPSLRNVEVTGPYFHDGRADTLEEAVKIMGRSELGRNISEGDVTSIIAFLKTLTGSYEGRKISATAVKETR